MAKTIVNKFAGKCDTCKALVAAGAGIATKPTNKWLVFCTADAPETHGANSPWRDQHIQGEMAYTGGEYTRSKARKLVNNEYSNTDELAEPCDCGGTCHWKATVGARICPSCGAMVVYKVDQATSKIERKVVATR